MARSTETQHAYFARIAKQNQRLAAGATPPRSLAETFARLEAIRRTQGELAKPGIQGDDTGDLEAHLRYLAHIRAVVERRGQTRA